MTDTACRVCGSETMPAGERASAFSGRTYQLRQCPACRFAFIANPWTDYARIYDEAYYAGRGADPLVNYGFEFAHPEHTVRQYEWRGLATVVGSLVPLTPATRWLDFGCGHGGLVRYLRERGHAAAFGYDTGAMAETGRAAGLPLLTDAGLDAADGSFDVVTLIEVIEHVVEPVELLARVRRLMRPGGLLFLTTGNAEPYRARLRDWRYVLPDVHISFFEPSTLGLALERAGFRPDYRRALPGYTDIIRFKLLKAFRVQRTTPVERVLPWDAIARLIDARFRISAHPIAWAR